MVINDKVSQKSFYAFWIISYVILNYVNNLKSWDQSKIVLLISILSEKILFFYRIELLLVSLFKINTIESPTLPKYVKVDVKGGVWGTTFALKKSLKAIGKVLK